MNPDSRFPGFQQTGIQELGKKKGPFHVGEQENCEEGQAFLPAAVP
jgi:hypothetical protein